MHWRRDDSWIDERSLATGRRNATFAGAGPQVAIWLWFHRSTQVRRACASLRFPLQAGTTEKPKTTLSSAPVHRKVAVEALAAELSVGLLIVDGFPDRRLE